MKKLIYLSSVVLALGLIACDPTTDTTTLTKQEQQLKDAVTNDVTKNIMPIYKDLAEKSLELSDACAEMLVAFDKGELTEAHVRKATELWVDARRYWELSESFLFGPVSDYNVDPHIDSWPLDKDNLETLLASEKMMKSIEDDASFVAANFGPGLLGFHALEYMLYDPTNDDVNNVRLHNIADYNRAQLVYTAAVAEDLAAQTTLLYACWAGADQLSEDQAELLEEFELEKPEFEFPFATSFTELGTARYKTYYATAEQVLQGCIDIADEVGNTKIGTPNGGADEEAKNYIESPYALNSIVDFQDNIRSIRNSFCGVNDAYSIYKVLVDNKLQDEADATVKAIDDAIAAIAAIPEPFILNATSSEADKAVKVVGTDLVKQLERVQELLSTLKD